MAIRAWRTEADYNRRLAPWIRWPRLVAAAALSPVAPLWDWAGAGWRRDWMRAALLGAVAICLLWPLDGWLLQSLSSMREHLPGDIRREMEAVQQFGQGGSIVLAFLLILSLDRAGWRRLADWLAAIGLTGAIVYPMKMLLGRPRPGLGAPDLAATPDASLAPTHSQAGLNTLYPPDHFLGPFGQHPFPAPTGLRHSWEVWADISADLWSMPSAHTAYAVVMAGYLGTAYPRAAWLMWIMAALVGLARVLFGAHYPTDVVTGATIGAAAVLLATRRRLGQRALRLA